MTACRAILMALSCAAMLLAAGSAVGPEGSARSMGWEPDRRLSDGPGAARLSYNFARSIAADRSGRVHVVWYAGEGANQQVFHRRSVDDGVNWGPAVRLSDARHAMPADPLQPAIAASESHVHVVWHEIRNRKMDLFFRRSADGGSSWDPAARLSGGPGNSAHASLAVTGSSVHVVWGDNRHGEEVEIYYRRSIDAGATWAPERRLTDLPFASWVSSVAAWGRNVYLAWVDTRDGNEEEYVKISRDGGMTWGLDTRLTDDHANSWAPSIALSGKTVHLVWSDQRDNPVQPLEAEKKLDEIMRLLGLPADPVPTGVLVPHPEASWRERAQRPPHGGPPMIYYGQALAMRVEAKMRRIHAAAPGWARSGGDPKRLEALLKAFERQMQLAHLEWEIYYKRSADGGISWGPDVRLTRAPGRSMRPSIAVQGDDLYVVWFDDRDGNVEVYFKHSADGGTSWGKDVCLTNAPGDSMHPSVAVSHRYVHVVWFDEREGTPQIYYKRKGRK